MRRPVASLNRPLSRSLYFETRGTSPKFVLHFWRDGENFNEEGRASLCVCQEVERWKARLEGTGSRPAHPVASQVQIPHTTRQVKTEYSCLDHAFDSCQRIGNTYYLDTQIYVLVLHLISCQCCYPAERREAKLGDRFSTIVRRRQDFMIPSKNPFVIHHLFSKLVILIPQLLIQSLFYKLQLAVWNLWSIY